jgi:HK97 family phage portal protein
MSPIEAAGSAIDLHNAASAWNKALLDNAARPSGALVYASEGHLNEEQFARLKAELEANYQGAMNAGRPLLLEGGLDWKTMSLSPQEMDFIEAKHAAAREIALALGLPPMLLGIPGDNTYANYAEANRVFWRQTVLPLVSRTLKAMTAWLAPGFGDGLELRPALDRIEALAGERAALWDRMQRVDFLSVDEKRAAVGYGPLEV